MGESARTPWPEQRTSALAAAADRWRRVPGCLPKVAASLALTALLSVITTLWSGTGPAVADEVRFLRIGTATTGGLYFPLGGVIASLISNPPGSRPCDRGGSCGVPGLIAVALATAGSVDNIALLRTGAIEAAIVQANVASWAYQGRGPYQGGPPFLDLRAIARVLSEAAQIVVRADGPIRTPADLHHRIVSIGEQGSGSQLDARLILGELGLTEADFEARYTRPAQAADDLVAGTVDALFVMGAHPYPVVRDLAGRMPLRLLPIDAETTARLCRRFEFLTPAEIRDTDYPGVPTTPTVGSGALLLVRADLNDALVHGMTTALWHETAAQVFNLELPAGTPPTRPDALAGVPVPLHPGAERYYREQVDDAARAPPAPQGQEPAGRPTMPDLLPSR